MWRYEQGDDRGEAALLFFSCENRAKEWADDSPGTIEAQ